MLRVLHGPVNVGNQPWVLSRYERKLGARSDCVVNYNTWFEYSVDRCLGGYAPAARGARFRRAAFGLSAPFRYDVLHFYFGRSFMCWDDLGAPDRWWFSDLRIARRLGRCVFMTLQGCDVRLSDESARRNAHTPCHAGQCSAVAACRSTLDARRRALIADVLPNVDRVLVLNPELARFVPGASFLPYASVDVAALEPVWPKAEGRPVVLHAPSDDGIKGSRIVVAALEELKSEFDFELVLVKRIAHAQAMDLYRRADLVIDQVLAGWYGGFAVEAMALGKPVACYLRDEDFGCLPPEMRAQLPLLRLSPDSAVADLRRILRSRHEWPEWGRRGRRYVERWHEPSRIAAALLRAYSDPLHRVELSES